MLRYSEASAVNPGAFGVFILGLSRVLPVSSRNRLLWLRNLYRGTFENNLRASAGRDDTGHMSDGNVSPLRQLLRPRPHRYL